MAKMEIDTSKPYFHRMIGCHGCAHEAAGPCRERNEHRNSGEIACILCIRAPKAEKEEMMEKIVRARGWSMLDFPKDMYISLERLVDVQKPSSMNRERMLLLAILSNEPLVYTKGEKALLRLGQNYSKAFKVKKAFAVHGFKGNQLFVTIPVTLDTLKGLGFIGKEK